MKVSRVTCLVLGLLLGCAHQVGAEGFALNEWSARGVSLAGGLMGRPDAVSALACNAARIPRLPGVRLMGGPSFIALLGSREAETTRRAQTLGLAASARLCQLSAQGQPLAGPGGLFTFRPGQQLCRNLDRTLHYL